MVEADESFQSGVRPGRADQSQTRYFREGKQQVEIICGSWPQGDEIRLREVFVSQKNPEPAVYDTRCFSVARLCWFVSNVSADAAHFCCNLLFPVYMMKLSGDESKGNGKRGNEHEQRLEAKARRAAGRTGFQHTTLRKILNIGLRRQRYLTIVDCDTPWGEQENG
ncbi:MAG: hypothetical protein HYV60_21640 [Planctomycetia bacterium]|nr:hypothetical protein [Planctomycetia bacterium]